MKALPPIPRSIKLPTGRIPVRRVKTLLKDEQAMGKYDWTKRVIYLDHSLEVNPAWLTLEHEKVHAILMDAGVQMDEQLEERVCDALAAARVAEMLAR